MNHSLIVFILLGALSICTQVQAHIDISVIACKTNDTDPEDELQLDGDEMFYYDFKTKELIYTMAEFAGKWTYPTWAGGAEANHQVCLNNLDVAVKSEQNPPEQIDPPQLTIYPRNEVVLGMRNILLCYVNNFYPAPVRVKWSRNNVEVKEGVTLSRYYPNSDFTFRQYSTIPFTPQEGDIYACTVEHKGLPEPETRLWEPEFRDESDIGETVYCGIGLTLGLLGVGAGTFFLVKGNNCN